MRSLVMLLIASATLGCSASLPAPEHQAELDNVARCFHEAVAVLQTEPETPDQLSMFMKQARAAVIESRRRSTDANFGVLRWNASGTSLVTSSGEAIRCRVASRTHENYGSDGSAWLAEYEFFVPDTDYRSRTTIQLTMPN